ncbi:MAG: hypothetical protein ACTSV5_04405, partial [Promethearchaeota archaeon]
AIVFTSILTIIKQLICFLLTLGIILKVEDAIELRRAYRSLDFIKITKEIILNLGKSVQLSPCCFNNQLWRYIFVYDNRKLREL